MSGFGQRKGGVNNDPGRPPLAGRWASERPGKEQTNYAHKSQT